ncbi:hypothetical protein C8R43DRAFT_883195, partial [Mycena crocata]
EYSSDGREATCWVPSEVNKKFSIHWTDPKASRESTFYGFVMVDGVNCGGRELILNRCIHLTYEETPLGPLLFAKQEFTDDDTFLNAPTSRDLGTIKFELQQVVCRKTRPKLRHFATLPPQKLHERSKKAMGLCIQFGSEFGTYNGGPSTDTVVQDLAVISFKYRPLELLEVNGIAPADKPRLTQRPIAVEVISDDEEAIASKIKALQVHFSNLC